MRKDISIQYQYFFSRLSIAIRSTPFEGRMLSFGPFDNSLSFIINMRLSVNNILLGDQLSIHSMLIPQLKTAWIHKVRKNAVIAIADVIVVNTKVHTEELT